MTELEIAKRCAEVMWNDDSASQALGMKRSLIMLMMVQALMP